MGGVTNVEARLDQASAVGPGGVDGDRVSPIEPCRSVDDHPVAEARGRRRVPRGRRTLPDPNQEFRWMVLMALIAVTVVLGFLPILLHGVVDG